MYVGCSNDSTMYTRDLACGRNNISKSDSFQNMSTNIFNIQFFEPCPFDVRLKYAHIRSHTISYVISCVVHRIKDSQTKNKNVIHII